MKYIHIPFNDISLVTLLLCSVLIRLFTLFAGLISMSNPFIQMLIEPAREHKALNRRNCKHIYRRPS